MKAKKYNEVNFWIYYNSTKVDTGLQVNEFGWHNSEAGYCHDQARTDYIIQFVLKGVCHLSVTDSKDGAEKEYDLRAGDAFIIYPHTHYRHLSDENEPCGRCWASFSGSAVSDCFKLCGIDADTHVVRDLPILKIEEKFNKLRTCCNKNPDTALRIQANMFDLMSLFAEKAVDGPLVEYDDNNKFMVDSVVAYIENHIGDKLSINDLAKMFGYERTQFYRIFKNVMNMSLQQFIMTRKMFRAVHLISETDIPIIEISQQLGFESYSAFTKAFKRWTTHAPIEYRTNKDIK